MHEDTTPVELTRHAKESGELTPRQIPSLEECYPSSVKMSTTVSHGGFDFEVPFRRINLTNDTHYDAYDTTGPQGVDPREGIAPLRAWF